MSDMEKLLGAKFCRQQLSISVGIPWEPMSYSPLCYNKI